MQKATNRPKILKKNKSSGTGNRPFEIMRTKTIFITGGSRGIGEAVVRKSVGTYNVVFTYNKNKDLAEKLVEELKDKGGITAVHMDLEDAESIKAAVKEAIKRYSRIDILVNNAGVSKSGLFTDMTGDEYEQIRKCNLDGPVLVTKEVLPLMLEHKDGSIVNIASIWGEIGASMEVAYSLTKAGIIGFTKALSKEVSLNGVRVNAVSPGAVDTDMMKEYTSEEIKSLCEEIPAGRLARPEEIADAVLFVATSEYITGQVLSVNGGWN